MRKVNKKKEGLYGSRKTIKTNPLKKDGKKFVSRQ